MDLNLIRLFIAIAESKNLSEAAHRSGVTRSNVSRRLTLLEKHYGSQLLRRTTRHMELTQAGRILYTHCIQALNELQNAQLQIDQIHHTIRGEIRIRIPTGLGHFHLKPLILAFCKSNPDLNVRLIINDQIHDLVASQVDLAIHITSAPLEDHVATKVCDIQWGLYASPSYGAPHSPELLQPIDIKKQKIITPLNLPQRLEFQHRHTLAPQVIQHTPFIQSGDYQFLFNAAECGLGIALLPNYAASAAVADGRLRKVLAPYHVKGVGDGLYLVRTSNRQPSAATLALSNVLIDAIRTMESRWNV